MARKSEFDRTYTLTIPRCGDWPEEHVTPEIDADWVKYRLRYDVSTAVTINELKQSRFAEQLAKRALAGQIRKLADQLAAVADLLERTDQVQK